MTMPHERTKAVIETRELLQLLARSDDLTVPSRIRDLARQLLRHFPLDVDLDASAAALPELWAVAKRRRTDSISTSECQRDTPPRTDADDICSGSPRRPIARPSPVTAEAGPILSERNLDLEIALRKIHELSMADGDLGYAYWYEVGQLLRQAASMRTKIDLLEKELERCRALLAPQS